MSVAPADKRREPAAPESALTGKVFAWAILAIALMVCFGVAMLFYLTWKARMKSTTHAGSIRSTWTEAARTQDVPIARFTDITAAAGLTFVHTNGAYGEKLLPETTGGGCAFF